MGVESALYKTRAMLGDPREPEKMFFVTRFIVKYLNDCFKSLIVRDDPYVLSTFATMTQTHAETCLMHICLAILTNCIPQADRSTFDVSSYTCFMESVDLEYSKFLDAVDYDNFFAHTCTGKRASECDPNIPLFMCDQLDKINDFLKDNYSEHGIVHLSLQYPKIVSISMRLMGSYSHSRKHVMQRS
jgi:hypothetical protein